MTSVFKRGKYWHYRLYRDGKDVWRSTHKTDRAEALEIAKDAQQANRGVADTERLFQTLVQNLVALPIGTQIEVRNRLARRLMMATGTPLKVADAWKAWQASPMKGNPSQVTVDGYSGYWRRFEEWATRNGIGALHEVTEEQAKAYASDLWAQDKAGRRLSPRTFNGNIVFLSGLFTTLRTEAGILENPWTSIRRMDRNTQGRLNFTPEELRAIVKHASGAIRFMVAIGLYTGLRMGDIVNLRWGDIQGDRIDIVPRKTKRKGKRLQIPVHPVLAGLLAERRREVTGDYLFPVEREEYARDVTLLTRRFQSFLTDTCGIVTTEAMSGRRHTVVRKGFHSLRHSFVSLAAASGVPQVVIQDLVGHGSAAMTAHYSHSSIAQKTAAIASIPEIGTPMAGPPDKEKPPEP